MGATDLALDADDLLKEAHEATHRFPPDFPGFSAVLDFQSELQKSEGSVTIRPGEPPEITISLPEVEAGWLEHELSSLASHRRHRSYADADGRSRKRLDDEPDHPLGRRVVIEDAMDSTYRIGSGVINEITRTHAGARFTIVIQQRALAPDGGLVSTAFTVFHWNTADGRLARADSYSDEYVELDGVLLPSKRRVATARDDGLRVRQFELSEHRLLEDQKAVTA